MTTGAVPPARFIRAGDSAIVIEFEERIDVAINARCLALADAVRGCQLSGVRDVVPAYRSVTVHFDPLHTEHDRMLEALKRAAGERPEALQREAPAHRIPVCYGGEFGPDLADVAAFARLPEADVIARHAAPAYHVFMLGFMPGFAYLGTVDRLIAVPRRETPRTRVPAGAVAIGSAQTGIYPMDTPGGWQLIGRTPIRVFDAARPRPSLFQPGDIVRFFPIERLEWDRYTSWGPAR
jgi:inhibitor of KinA